VNNKKVDRLIPDAYQVIKDVGIVNGDKVPKAYRGQISAFGASIATGSLLSAISFFSKKGSSEADRPLLMKAILRLADPGNTSDRPDALYRYAAANPKTAKEDVLIAAVAIKLAMNLYDLSEESTVRG